MIAAPAQVTARAALQAGAFHAPAGTAAQAVPFLRFDGVTIRLGGREILSPTSFDVARGEAFGRRQSRQKIGQVETYKIGRRRCIDQIGRAHV